MRASVAALAVLLTLAGCSSSSSSSSSAPEKAPDPTPTATPATWNPCSGLDAKRVGRALGARVTEETGTPDNPRCAFLPVSKDGPTLNVTYTQFDGSFERAWTSMGHIDGAVRDLDIAGATAARVVVNRSPKAVFVTGFVQSHGLIETVNAVQLRPYDATAVTAATRDVLATLVARAPASQG